MKITEYNKMKTDAKVRIVLNYGELIEEFFHNNSCVSLYSLDLFFVEVITTIELPTKVLEIQGFNDGDKLNKYTLSRSLNKNH